MSNPDAIVEPLSHEATKRSQSAVVGTLTSVLARFLSMPIQVLSTGMLARTLSPEAFGLWTLLFTLLSYASNLDFGLSQALRLSLAKIHSSNNESASGQRLFFGVL